MMAKTAPRLAPDGLIKIVTKTRNPADALWSTQRRLLTLTAGPLAVRDPVTELTFNPMKMNQRLAYVTLIVDDYDKAIDFYTTKLNFQLVEDSIISENKRWVLIKPNGKGHCCLLLAKASDEKQISFIGNQTGGRVFLFLFTDNFERDYQNLLDNKINIERKPRDEQYGKVVVFRDIYGNLWDLIQPKN